MKKTMTDEQKAHLKSLPRKTCTACGSKQGYMNPMMKCFECKKPYCFEHSHRGLWKKGMKNTELWRDVCDSCKESKGYIDLV
jgi:hypothetical protein